jgi:hypothetical protein
MKLELVYVALAWLVYVALIAALVVFGAPA